MTYEQYRDSRYVWPPTTCNAMQTVLDCRRVHFAAITLKKKMYKIGLFELFFMASTFHASWLFFMVFFLSACESLNDLLTAGCWQFAVGCMIMKCSRRDTV